MPVHNPNQPRRLLVAAPPRLTSETVTRLQLVESQGEALVCTSWRRVWPLVRIPVVPVFLVGDAHARPCFLPLDLSVIVRFLGGGVFPRTCLRSQGVPPWSSGSRDGCALSTIGFLVGAHANFVAISIALSDAEWPCSPSRQCPAVSRPRGWGPGGWGPSAVRLAVASPPATTDASAGSLPVGGPALPPARSILG